MQKLLKDSEPYKELMSQASQCTLQVLDRNWKSFFISIKDWKKNPSKYLGMPKLPKYKKKDGRFPWYLKNNQAYITDEGKIRFKLKVFNGYEFPTKVKGRLISIRFIPRGNVYVMEVVYETEIKEEVETNDNILGIDLGVNNLITMVNNIGRQPIIINGKGVKSVNQYWNKRKSVMQSELKRRNNKDWSRKLNEITLKRDNRLNNYFHHASRFVVNYCLSNNIRTIVIGKNDKWKQRSGLGKKNNQNFIYIPHEKLIFMIKYKAEENNIKVIETEESYTSGTSFLDNELPIKENYDKKRRIKRGLFKTNNGSYINSDVNGAFQIIRKVFPNVKSDGIEGILIPIVINLCK